MVLTSRFRSAAKICVVLLVLLLLLIGGLHLLLRAGGLDKRLRSRIEATLTRQLQREVQVGRIRLGPLFNSLELGEIVVKSAGAVPLAQVESVHLYPDLGLLLRGVIAIKTVIVQRPILNLSEEPGTGRERPDGQELLVLPAKHVQIRGGAFRLQGEGRQWRVEGFDADLNREGAEMWGEVRIAEGVLDLPEQSLRWGNVEALVVLTKQDLVVTRLGMGIGNGSIELTGRVADPFGERTLDLRLTAELGLGTSLPGRIRLAGHLLGSAQNPRFQGDARLEGTWWYDLGIALSADREEVRGEQLRLLAASGEVSGSFHLRWNDLAYHASVEGKGLEFHQAGNALPVSGILTLRAVAEGRGLTAAGLKAQTIFRVLVRERGGRSAVVGRADGLVKAQEGRVSLEHLRVDLPPNHLTMKGSLWKELHLDVSGKFPRVDLVGELLGAKRLGGKGDVEGRLVGPLTAPVFQGMLAWDAAHLLGTDFSTIRGEIQLQQRRLVAPRLHVSKGESSGTVDLRLALPEQQAVSDLDHHLRIEATGQITGVPRDLLSVFVKSEIPLAGRMTLDANVTGVPARVEGQGHVRLTNATVLGEPWQDVEADLVLEPIRLVFKKVRLARGAEHVMGSGFLRLEDGASNFRLTTEGLSIDGFRLFQGTGLHGKVRGEMHGEGPLNNPTIRGEYTLESLRYATVPLGSGQGSFLLHERTMTAQSALPKTGYSVRGHLQTVQPHSYDVQVTMEQAELAPLFVLASLPLIEEASGTGSGAAHVLGNLDRRHPSAFTLELDAPTIRIHGKAFHATQPVHVEMRDDVLTISPLAVTGDEGWLNARGQIAYHGDVDIDVKGRIPLAVLLPGPGLITGVNGHGRLEMKLSGRLEAPRYTGWLRVEKGDLRFVDHPEFIGGVNGQVRFQGWKIQVPGVEGRWAGGMVKLTGDASHIRGKGWRWVTDLRLHTADAKRVFTREEKGKGRVTGRTDFTGQLTAEGRHREELRRSVQGKLRLDLKDGKFEQYTVLANIVRILNLTPDPTSGVPYDFLKAVFSLRGGVAETQDLLFISDTMRVGGLGKIDLGRGEVDMLLGVQPLRTVDRLIRGTQLHKVPLLGRLLFGEEGSVLVVSMKVKGPLEAPEVSVVPLESVGRGIFGIFRRILELPGGLSPAESSGRREK